jgi:hypothetical protein
VKVVKIESPTLVGSVRRTDGTVVVFVPPDDPPTGVREPRRPTTPAAPAVAEVES